MTACYINGKYKKLSQSSISVTDRGFQFSDGVYEVIAIYNNKFVDENLHLNRLRTSLNKLNIKINLSIKQIQNISHKIKKLNKISNGIIYLQVTRGDQHPRDHKYKKIMKPNIVIYSIKKDFKKLDQLALKGVKTSLYPDIRWLRSDIKSISLLGNVMAANYAKKNNSHEAILFDHKNNITEGNSSSIWIIKKNICYTHPLTYRILKGCTRNKLITILKAHKFKFKEKLFSKKALLDADEVFMTSATNFIMPIIKVDTHKISNGKPGSFSQRLRKEFINSI
jgi:D-alanine transaminase